MAYRVVLDVKKDTRNYPETGRKATYCERPSLRASRQRSPTGESSCSTAALTSGRRCPTTCSGNPRNAVEVRAKHVLRPSSTRRVEVNDVDAQPRFRIGIVR